MKSYLRIVLFALLATPGFTFADEHGHNHESSVEDAPHGGTLRDAPPYKAELKLDGDNAKIFIYTKTGDKLEPVTVAAEKLEGQVRYPKEKKDRPVTFAKKTMTQKDKTITYFEAKLAGVAKLHRYDLHVILAEKDKKIVLDFGVDNIH